MFQPDAEPTPDVIAIGSRTARLSIMLSSTSLDLPLHRKEVMDAILRVGHFPLAMEHGTAEAGSNAIRYSLGTVEQADLLYLAHEDHPFTMKQVETDPIARAKLESLKSRCGKSDICGFFKSPEELRSLVIQSLSKVRVIPAASGTEAGPSKPAIPRLPEPYCVPSYILTNKFTNRLGTPSPGYHDLHAWALARFGRAAEAREELREGQHRLCCSNWANRKRNCRRSTRPESRPSPFENEVRAAIERLRTKREHEDAAGPR